MNFTPPPDQRVARLIDANLDRAREGIRVIEDWCRFGLSRKDLVLKLKDWRHQLSLHHHETYKQARSSSTDQGALLNQPSQEHRIATNDIISANCSRVQEALRVLEEFTRKSDPELAKDSAKIRYEFYDFEINILKINLKNQRHKALEECNLYLITTPKEELIKIVDKALHAGIKMVQYRSKQFSDHKKLAQAKELSSLCKRHNAMFIINDRIDLALAVDADGVHLGQDDLPTDIARKLLGKDRLIGRSTHCIEQLKQAEQEGCDYMGLGPVFKTENKPSSEPVGLNYLIEASNTTKLPCFAIGGINTSNLSDVTSSGIKRIAVLNAIMNGNDPASTTSNFLSKLKNEN